MRALTIIFAAIICVVLMGAVVWEGGPDAVIFPPQKVEIYFTHNYHTRKPNKAANVTGEGLACAFCHENVGAEMKSADRDIPGHSSCESCHDGEETFAMTACDKCHTDLRPGAEKVGTSTKPVGLVIPDPNIRFAHADHVRNGVRCTECHTNVPQKTVATRDDYPTMDRCIACHEARHVSTACTTCHLSTPSGRVMTEYAEGKLKPRRYHTFMIHDADFLRDHAVPAQRDKGYCLRCHGEDYCLSCHDGSARDVRYHPGDWLAMHSIRSVKDDYRCQSCHRLQTFCLDCHVRSGVATVGTTGNPLMRRTIRTTGGGFSTMGAATGPHPMRADGWVNPQSKNFHGFFAQRNIRACSSCHQEQFCLTCHSAVSGTHEGGNPHGPDGGAHLRGSTARKHDARMCLKCHSPSDPNWR